MKISLQKGIKVVLAGLMTLILMYISSNIYHKSPFIEVEFQTSQNKAITYQVFYTTDDKNPLNFNEKQSVKKNVSAGLHTEHIILPTPKIAQFRFDFGEYPGEVNVLKIALKGKNKQVLNLKDFKFVNIDSQTVQNNQLMLVSKQKDPQMIHQKPLNIVPYQPIDWCFFFGLLCIYGALSYALVSYLNILKISGKHTPFPVIFLCLFFGALFIPMMHISNETTAGLENRTLAKMPIISEIFKEKSEYGKAFENWFNDHFFGRDQIIRLHDKIRNEISQIIRTDKAVYFKKNKWIFLTPFVLNPSVKIIEPIIQNLKKFNAFCQENNIKLYILMVPKKEIIYQEFLYNYGFDKKESEKAEQVYRKTQKEAQKINVPFIFPKEELKKGKQQDYVFFKLTAHWTDWGAYIGYQTFMKEVQKDFPDIPVVTLNEYNKSQNKLIRDSWERTYHKGWFRLYFNESYDKANDTDYTYYDYKNSQNLTVQTGKFMKDYSYPEGKYRIMLIGDSMNDDFLQFLPYSAGELKYIRINRAPVSNAEQWKIMKLYKKDILSFKPDILILLFGAHNFWGLLQLFGN